MGGRGVLFIRLGTCIYLQAVRPQVVSSFPIKNTIGRLKSPSWLLVGSTQTLEERGMAQRIGRHKSTPRWLD
jgi:hypothetical protein